MRNHFRNFLLLVCGLSVLLLASCSSGGGSNGGSASSIDPGLKRAIKGTIADALNNPMADVTVTLTDTLTAAEIATTITAADGSYIFNNLPIGNYTVTPYKASYIIFSPDSYINISTANALSVAGKNFTANVVIVSGLVTNVVLPPGSPTALADVAISAVPADPLLPTLTATSAADGTYTLALIGGEAYAINFTKDGYAPVVYSFAADSLNVSLEPVRMLKVPDQTTGTGNASGKIINAFDGKKAPGLTVNLRGGMNTTSGDPISSTTTDVEGDYSFSGLPAGIYTAQINGQIVNTGDPTPYEIPTSYATVIVVGGTSYPDQDFEVIGGLGENQYRIVLTWDELPRDLDSHLTGPAAPGDGQTGSRFHVYYANKGYEYGGTQYAGLDLDDVTSYGPETTTIYKQLPGTYRFSVHRYSSDGTLAASGGQVKLYNWLGLKATFRVPTNNTSANLWTVFEINDDTVTRINTLTSVAGPGSVRSAPLETPVTDAYLLWNLQPKR